MRYVGSFTKQNYDIFGFTVDCTPRLGSGEEIASYEVKAYKISDDSDVSSTVLGTPSESSGVVTVWVKAGVDAAKYDIRLRVVGDGTPASQIEADFEMTIQEIGKAP